MYDCFFGGFHVAIERKNMKKKLGIVAAICIVLGFGMIHGSYPNAEIYGGSLIGLGSLYLLFALYNSGKKKE